MEESKVPVNVVAHTHGREAEYEYISSIDPTRVESITIWRHLSPWVWQTIDEGHHAIVSALKRIVDAYESSYDVVRLANELLQLAAELEHIQELSGAM